MSADRIAVRGPVPDEGRTRDRARILNALGDPIRLGVVDLLDGQDLSPDALGAALGVPGNLLAHHLKVLQTAGVVTRAHSQSDRRRTYIHLVPGVLAGLLPAPAPLGASRVVFVCTHNSARSVLAESLWQTVSTVPTASAGTHPAEWVHPRTRTAARRAGLQLVRTTPQAITGVLRPDDVVVSVCDTVNEHLDDIDNPRLHWSVPDPAAVDTDAAFETALVEIGDRVTQLARRTHPISDPDTGPSPDPAHGHPRSTR